MAETANQHYGASPMAPVQPGTTISYELPATSTADWTEGQTHTARRQFQGQHTNGDASEEEHLKRRTQAQMMQAQPIEATQSPRAGKPTLEKDLHEAPIGGEAWKPGKKVFNWEQQK